MTTIIRRTAALVLLGGAFLGASLAEAAVIRGPYLQQPTPTSILVRWRTDGATDSRVDWGLDSSLGTFVTDAAVVTEHEIRIDGLDPSTTYFYAAGSTGTPGDGDLDHHFTTPPPVGSVVPTRIWAIGDSGFPEPADLGGGRIRNGDAVRDAYIAFNGGVASADVWLLLGDNAYNIATDAEYQTALFEQYPGFVATVAPWACLGNHEGFSANGLTESGPYFDVFSLPTGGEGGGVPSGTEAYYAFDHANIHFVALDAEDSINDATAEAAMLGWLEADLAATHADWVIAFWHRPPYSKGLFHDSDVEGNEIRMREDVLPILESYGVDLVLNGHSHNYERSFLIDGHYGLSGTFGPEHLVDGGDGDPGGDGAYEKPNRGPVPHEGAVYVVAGSASEKRPGLGAHPVMAVSLVELGSLVLDVADQTATGRFLDETGTVQDTFVIQKEAACPATPVVGCEDADVSKLVMKTAVNGKSGKLKWSWKNGNVDPAAVGNPADPAGPRLDVCVYESAGNLVVGGLPAGPALWRPTGTTGYLYKDKPALRGGIARAKVKTSTVGKGRVKVAGKSTQLTIPDTLGTPVTVQFRNDDTVECWESVFDSQDVKRNARGKFVAKLH